MTYIVSKGTEYYLEMIRVRKGGQYTVILTTHELQAKRYKRLINAEKARKRFNQAVGHEFLTEVTCL